jgi:hypothetical protein
VDIPLHLLPTKIARNDYGLTRHFLPVNAGVTPEHVVDPDFWVHLSRGFKVFDEIAVVATDGTFDLDLRVVAIDPRGLWTQVRVLRLWEGKTADSAPAGQYPDKDGYTIEFAGPHRWRIVRGGDVVAKDFADQAAAVEALVNIKDAKRPPAAAAKAAAKAA